MSADGSCPSTKCGPVDDDAPAGRSSHQDLRLPARAPDQHLNSIVEPALDAGRDVRPGRAPRTDGWTPDRIATFLYGLAETATVAEAAAAAGMSRQSAYALRNSAKGRPFALAWDAAVLRAGPSLADTLTARGIHGWDEPVFHQGKVCGHRRRYADRLAFRLLNRHDRREAAIDRRGAAARLVAEEFEPFVEIVAAGGEGSVDFVGERMYLARRGIDETDLLERADNYHRCGGGLACEIDVSDLDPADRANWTDGQVERARRSGLLESLGEEEKQDPADNRPHGDRSDPA